MYQRGFIFGGLGALIMLAGIIAGIAFLVASPRAASFRDILAHLPGSAFLKNATQTARANVATALHTSRAEEAARRMAERLATGSLDEAVAESRTLRKELENLSIDAALREESGKPADEIASTTEYIATTAIEKLKSAHLETQGQTKAKAAVEIKLLEALRPAALDTSSCP